MLRWWRRREKNGFFNFTCYQCLYFLVAEGVVFYLFISNGGYLAVDMDEMILQRRFLFTSVCK